MIKNIAVILFILSYISCKKRFEEGQGNCLTSINKRIAGNWELQKLVINNVDSTDFYTNIFKVKCIFKIENRKSRDASWYAAGAVSMIWGQDTNQIRVFRLWTGTAKGGILSLEPEKDNMKSFFLYPFCQSWYSEVFDIRYLSKNKMILQIKVNEECTQRLEFSK